MCAKSIWWWTRVSGTPCAVNIIGWSENELFLKVHGVNPRPAGGFERPPPLRFFEDSENMPKGFHPPYPHVFRNFCKNFDPMSCKVRSPGQVKWPNYIITFQSRHGYNVSGKVMKLSEYEEVISAYKTFILDFDIGDLRSGHFCDLPIISQWAKNQPRYIYFGASLFEWNHIV